MPEKIVTQLRKRFNVLRFDAYVLAKAQAFQTFMAQEVSTNIL